MSTETLYSIDQIIDELKKQEKYCANLSMRIVKSRLDQDKQAALKTLLEMSSQIVADTQMYGFLIDYLYDLKAKEIVK